MRPIQDKYKYPSRTKCKLEVNKRGSGMMLSCVDFFRKINKRGGTSIPDLRVHQLWRLFPWLYSAFILHHHPFIAATNPHSYCMSSNVSNILLVKQVVEWFAVDDDCRLCGRNCYFVDNMEDNQFEISSSRIMKGWSTLQVMRLFARPVTYQKKCTPMRP